MIKAGKWVMSFQWRMCGIELHCDTSIGKHLSSLAQTLTALAGEPDVANIDSVTEAQFAVTREVESRAKAISSKRPFRSGAASISGDVITSLTFSESVQPAVKDM